MGPKDRILHDIPPKEAQRLSVRNSSHFAVTNSGHLGLILLQMKIFKEAAIYQQKRPGRPAYWQPKIKLTQFLDEHSLTLSTDENSPTVQVAAEALHQSPGRIVKISHQVKKLAHYQVIPQYSFCRLTHREVASLRAALGCASLSSVRIQRTAVERHKMTKSERWRKKMAQMTLLHLGKPWGQCVKISNLGVLTLLHAAETSPDTYGSALPSARRKLRAMIKAVARVSRRMLN